MELISSKLSQAELWLIVATLLYFLMNGAQIFETFIFVPRWSVSPPSNFFLLLDKSGTSLKNFWIIFHSLHEIAFILAVVFCWKIVPVRNALLLLFALHFAVRIWTIFYFAPAIMEFQKIAEQTAQANSLMQRVAIWKLLNYLRVAIYIAISFGMVSLCIKVFSMRLS